jgi:PPM family protein phosphatase
LRAVKRIKQKIMTFQYFALTDTGRIRENNEDAVVFDEAAGVAVLADGMGGYNAGEVASHMATSQLRNAMVQWLQGEGVDAGPAEVNLAMQGFANDTNLSIFHAAQRNPQYFGMGTTLVMGIFKPDVAHIGHIGDSRCYRLRGGRLEQITRDHSLLQEQIDAGLVTQEQAMFSSIRNLVTRAVGVDVYTVLEVKDFEIEPGDLFLMCSDGLSDMVDSAGIAKIMSADDDIKAKAKNLINAANAQGGRDNISVLLIEAPRGNTRWGVVSRILGLQ